MMKKFRLVLFLVLGVSFVWGQPVNDEPETATPITVTDEFTELPISYTGASTSEIPNDCGRNPNTFYDVWYSYTSDGNHLTLQFSEGNWVFIELFLQINGILFSQGCLSLNANIQECSINIANAGTAFLRVSAQYSGQDATLSLALKQAPGPTNDEPENAIPIGVNDNFTTLTIDHSGATNSDVPNSCGLISNNFKDLWYSFQGTGEDITVRKIGGGFMRVEVFLLGSDGELISQGCREVYPDDSGAVYTVSAPGTLYLRTVPPSTSVSVVDLEVRQAAATPVNDEVDQAIPIIVPSTFNTIDVNYTGATYSEVLDDCGEFDQQYFDVWYSFTADSQFIVFQDVPGGILNDDRYFAEIFLLETNGTLTSLGCESLERDGRFNYIEVIEPGTVLIRLTQRFRQNASFPFTIKQSDSPENDEVTGALPITVTNEFSSTLIEYCAATPSLIDNSCNIPSQFTYDVWYTFTGTGGLVSIKNMPGGHNAIVELFLDDGNGISVSQACITTSANGSVNPFNVSGPGTLFMRVTRPFAQAASLTLELKQASALPVTLTTFYAEATPGSKSTHLTWQTASETANDHFEVERSTDGQTFLTLGRVTGVGTSNTVQNYTYTDHAPQAGTNFYRLRQVDFDGTSSLSEVRMVAFAEEASLRIYPNPAGPGSVTVQFPESLKNQTLELIAADGRQVLSQPASVGRLSTDLLAPGVYFVRVGELVVRMVVR